MLSWGAAGHMARDLEEEEMGGFTEVKSRSLQQGNIPLERDAEWSVLPCAQAVEFRGLW